MWIGMLEKVSNEKSQRKNTIIKKPSKIIRKAIIKLVWDNARDFGPIQKNIQPQLAIKVEIKVSCKFQNFKYLVKIC